jgi:hypothetical protein
VAGDHDAADRGDPLDRPINDAGVFWATVAHAARLHNVSADHVTTGLRLGGVRGVPVTARMVHDAAAALASAGYVLPPRAPEPLPPDVAALAVPVRWRRARCAAVLAGWDTRRGRRATTAA